MPQKVAKMELSSLSKNKSLFSSVNAFLSSFYEGFCNGSSDISRLVMVQAKRHDIQSVVKIQRIWNIDPN
jgi:hypothetical protein